MPLIGGVCFGHRNPTVGVHGLQLAVFDATPCKSKPAALQALSPGAQTKCLFFVHHDFPLITLLWSWMSVVSAVVWVLVRTRVYLSLEQHS